MSHQTSEELNVTSEELNVTSEESTATSEESNVAAVDSNFTAVEITVLDRTRILSLHLISFLFENQDDHNYMMEFLRGLLDWLAQHIDFKKIQVNKTCCNAVEMNPFPTLREPSQDDSEVNDVISECLETELTDHEMACKVDDIIQETDGDSTDTKLVPMPPLIYKFLFDTSHMGDLLDPLESSECSVIVKLMVVYAVGNGRYDSRARTFITNFSEVVNVEYSSVKRYEVGAVEEAVRVTNYTKKKEKRTWGSVAAVGVAATGGALLMTLTGGLAAPLVVGGLAAVVGTSSTAFLATTAGLAGIAAVFGAVGGGLAGYKVSRLVGGLEEFRFVEVKVEPSSTVTILVNGLSGSTDWGVVCYNSEQYLLQFDSKHLARFTSALGDFVRDTTLTLAAEELVKYTVLSTLVHSLTWPVSILSLTNVIDNPWSICMKRSKAAGKHLATILSNHVHGHRPATLVGYGFGARVLFFCMLELFRLGCCNVVENVVVCGAPVTSNPRIWSRCCRVVSGKIYNGYSRHDWVLSFLYKTTHVTRAIAGLRPICLSNRRLINMDLSQLIQGHSEYANKMAAILMMIGMG